MPFPVLGTVRISIFISIYVTESAARLPRHLGTSAPCHEINAKAIGLDLDSNPELYEGGWEPRFEPRAL